MCGGESTIRIERADNGYTIDAYAPGSGDKPGKHKKIVATSPEMVLKALASHLGKGKGRRGTRVTGGEVAEAGPRKKSGGKKKKMAYKR